LPTASVPRNLTDGAPPVTGAGATLDYEAVWGKLGYSRTEGGAVFTLHSRERDKDFDCETRRLDLVS
jgi:hypothetical protein